MTKPTRKHPDIFRPLCGPEADRRSTWLWRTLYWDSPDRRGDLSFDLMMLLVTGVIGMTAAADIGALANGPELASVLAALPVGAMSAMAGWMWIEAMSHRLARRLGRGRIEHVIRSSDFNSGHELNAALRRQDQEGLLIGGLTLDDVLVAHTDLPKRIGTWQDTVDTLGGNDDDVMLHSAALLARSLNDNELARARAAIDGRMSTATTLGAEIVRQAATLDAYETNLKARAQARSDAETEAKRAKLEARNILDDAEAPAAAARLKVEALLELQRSD